MKALSLTQPWATLVVMGEKKIETRSWQTKHQGLIAIHASARFPTEARNFAQTNAFVKEIVNPNWFDISDQFPLGAIIGTVEIVACRETQNILRAYESDPRLFGLLGVDNFSEKERTFGDYSSFPKKRFGWFLRNPQILKTPIPCKGALSLWEVPTKIADRIMKANKSL